MIENGNLQLDHYRLLRLLTQEDMTEVYLGEHAYLKTSVVIRILRLRLEKDELESFQAEARKLGLLKHPALVPLLDFGIAAGGFPYVVLPYIPYGTLRQRHPAGTRVPLDQVVGYVRQIAAALQEAHNKQMLHGDVRPENMLIGEQGQILLENFRLHRPSFPVSTNTFADSERTHPDLNEVGALSYLSPEQIRGHVLPASDQYALAIVVYEWLTGMVPFRGAYQEILLQHLSERPAPLRAHLPIVSSAVEEVILRALAKAPQARFASIETFATAFQRAAASPKRFTQEEETLCRAILTGPTGQVILDAGEVTLGRARNNSVVLSDPKISAHHAEVRVGADGCRLADLESLNGTFVNERRLPSGEEYRLQPGDTLRLGDTQFTFDLVNAEHISESIQETVRLAQLPALPQETPLTPPPAARGERDEVLLQQGDKTRTMTTEVPLPPLTVPRPSHQAISPPSSLTPPISPKKTQPQQQRGLGRAFALVGLVFVILAGSLGGLLLVQHNQLLQQQAQTRAQATAMAVRQATARAQATATATVTSPYPPFTHLALFDPLTDPNGSNALWASGEGSQCQFTAQGYLVSTAQKSLWFCLAEATNFPNFAYQVTMTIVQGDCGGLAFRAQPPALTYDEYLICVNGMTLAAVTVNGVTEASWGGKSPHYSPAIHRGEDQVNTIAVVAQGATIQLYANGEQIGTLQDTMLTHGRIGVVAIDALHATSVRYTHALVWTERP